MTARGYARLPDLVREVLARAIHESYRVDQAGRKAADDPAMADWDELPEHLRESNRDQAAHIVDKLHALGYTVHAAGDGSEPIAFTPEEVERMAVMEHDRFVAERRAAGWRPGPERDVDAKVTPYLVSWDDLPEHVREWDREPVRRIPELLADVGLEVRRRE
jgi:RyR domain